jgi:hypothetical protein
MGAGMMIALIGLTLRGFSGRSKEKTPGDISTSYGIFILLAIVVAFFVIVSRM